MNNRVLRLLEYNTVLEILSGMAVSAETVQLAKELMPVTDIGSAKYLQRETSEAVSMIIKSSNPPLSPITSIIAPVTRASMDGILNMSELLSVGACLRVSRILSKYIMESTGFELLTNTASRIVVLRDLENKISVCILSDEQMADDASPKLHDIRRKMRALNNKVKDILNDMIHSSRIQKFLQEPIITMRGDRYVVPVKSEHKGEIQGILHDVSATGATMFIEPMTVVQTNNQLRSLEVEEHDEIERILAEFSAEVATVSNEIITNYKSVIELDLVFAKAKFSLKLKAVEPELNDLGKIRIIKGRHPLIDPKKVVPIDVNIGNEFDTLVITGPNTGGKTVTLKTMGLFTLMAQAGLHVPAGYNTELSVFEKVFADIGDEQSIEQSLSTFSSHMVNIVEILKQLDGKSLALFDELGAGTDPDEGAALAISILEYVRSKGAKAAATTHYSELKLYAITTDGVENASCEFDVETLCPTYRLLLGIPGKSNAFAISKRLGLCDEVIESAKVHLTSESVRFEDIVAELEHKRIGATRAYEEANLLKIQAERHKQDADSQKDSLERQRQKFIQEAKAEARKIIEQAKDETAELLKDVKRLAMDNNFKEQLQNIEKIRSELKQKGNEIDDEILNQRKKGSGVAPKKLLLGNTVDIVTLGESGSVSTLPDNKGDLFVQVGIMKMKVNIKDLRLVERVSDKKAGQRTLESRNNTGGRSMTVGMELDLRGQTIDEAIFNLDKFLDDAVLSSLSQISIIHGKGTGALRAAVQDFLKCSKFVKNYRLGRYGEGDTGVTIVELK